MIVEIEVAGEAGAREVGLVPAPVRQLRLDEPAHRAVRDVARLAGGVEREQRPRGLRRRRRAASAPLRLAVRAEVLAEAAVLVLHAPEPRNRAAHAPVLAQAARDERGNGGAGAVDVVRAPAAEPRAVGLLRAQQPLEPAPRLGSVRPALERERLEDVRGDVRARRVRHLAKVADGELVH